MQVTVIKDITEKAKIQKKGGGGGLNQMFEINMQKNCSK